MRKIIACMFMVLLAACGGQQQRAGGIQEETMLIIRSEQLVGATVSVQPAFERVITEQDLTPYGMGVAGATDREEERLETLTIKVDAGTHRVKVTRGGNVVLDKELYFSQGQTRELRVR